MTIECRLTLVNGPVLSSVSNAVGHVRLNYLPRTHELIRFFGPRAIQLREIYGTTTFRVQDVIHMIDGTPFTDNQHIELMVTAE